jgi:hypothetical protein
MGILRVSQRGRGYYRFPREGGHIKGFLEREGIFRVSQRGMGILWISQRGREY